MKRSIALLLALLCLLSGCIVIELPYEIPSESITTEQTKTPTELPTETQAPKETEKGTQSTQPPPTEETPTQPPLPDPDTPPALERPQEGPVYTSDPYANVTAAQFYANYRPAVSASDAYYRTKHSFLSGSMAEQDQEPTLAQDRPMENGKFLRNTASLYSESGDAYYVVNAEGEIVNTVYRDGAYVTLEEVAAYVFAFGDVPPNYTYKKSGNPSSNSWGKYLRLNHSEFSGDVDRYPYEPILPDISGCGGDTYYYEIDIGTTGTDCDPDFPVVIYNNGSKITRGAARIVYTRYDKNGDEIIDINEKYLFYTYNHYNDFQEYLNYEGGWGEMFGNITGGGSISSKSDYNPTDYVPTARAAFFIVKNTKTATVDVIWYYDPRALALQVA